MRSLPRRCALVTAVLSLSLAGAAACGARVSLGDGATSGATDAAAPRDAGAMGIEDDASPDAARPTTPGVDASDAQGSSPTPPWELDAGADGDAACAGQTLGRGGCLVTLATDIVLPRAITLDATSVYWVAEGRDLDTGAIGKVPRGGGAVVTLASGLRDPRDIVVDATTVYWGGRRIMAVAIDGGVTRTLFDDSNSTTAFVTRAGSKLYWADSQYQFGLDRANLDGSARTQLVGPAVEIGGLAWCAAGVVFTETTSTEGGSGHVVVAGSDGTLTTILTVPGALGAVKSAGDVVVFTDSFRSMYWVPLRGGSPGLLTSNAYPSDIVTDGTFVYWADANLRAIVRLDIHQGAPEVLVSYEDTHDVSGYGSLTLDANSVYFTEPGAGKVLKLTPR